MKKYKITEQAFKDARAFQDKVDDSGLFDKPNYTGLNEKDRFYYGYLGEWAFAQFLISNNIPFEWDDELPYLISGHVDIGDFVIYGKIYDVKTASKSYYHNLMFPQSQLRYWRDFYVACKIDGEWIEVIGFIDRKTMEQIKPRDFGKGIPTISMLFENLIPVEELE